MSDDADHAQDLLQVEIGAALSLVPRTIPAGAPGECDDCGETMPRLVGGRCAFCRDGRRPPLSTFDRLEVPAPAPPALPLPRAAEAPMPNPPGKQNVTITVDADVYNRITARATAGQVSRSHAARELIELAFAALDTPVPAPTPELANGGPHDGSEESILDWLEHVPNYLISQEVARRMGDGVSDAEYAAAVERAQAADDRWQALRAQLRGLAGEG